jgi:hypothetical protein
MIPDEKELEDILDDPRAECVVSLFDSICIMWTDLSSANVALSLALDILANHCKSLPYEIKWLENEYKLFMYWRSGNE